VLVAVLLVAVQLVSRGAASATTGLNADRWAGSAAAAGAAGGTSSARVAQLLRLTDAQGDRLDLAGQPAASPALLAGYRWPLEHARITQGFGRSAIGLFVVDGQRFHDGIDIASFCGDHVVAAHDGVVIAAGRHVDAKMGWVGDLAAYEARLTAKSLWSSVAIGVIIDDGNGYRSVYLHFWKVVVKTGQVVHAGDLLGLEGATGHATGCHLHYSLFSPDAAARYETLPARVKDALLPAAEIARVDPILVLPPPSTAGVIWGWGAQDSP